MSEIIHDFLMHHLYLCALIIFICFLVLLGAMAIDFFAGVQKAKERGEARTSTGYKMTCDKARKYFPTFAIAAFMDVVTCIIVPFPIFAIVWTLYLCWCEFQSVREKSWQKAEIRKQDRTMQVILENKDDFARAMVEVLKEQEKEASEKQEKKGGDNGNVTSD